MTEPPIAFCSAPAAQAVMRRRLRPAVQLTLRASVLWVVLLGSLVAVCATAEGANWTRKAVVTLKTPVTGGSRYLALGDSVTFGYQEPQVVPAPNYRNPTSFLGYPEQLGAELHLRVINAACPGETSASLTNPSA